MTDTNTPDQSISSLEGAFTPGPWSIGRDKHGYVSMYSGPSVYSADRLMIADVLAGRNAAETHANARLIAAAPALVEALKRSAEGWANAIELRLLPPQHVPAAQVLLDEARAALLQALGAEK